MAIKKVLLISSSFESVSLITSSRVRADGFKLSEQSHYPVGLASLQAFLVKEGHDVRLLWLNSHSFDSCLQICEKELGSFSPEYVGFQILTPNRGSSFKLMNLVHDRYPRSRILVGGIHTTILHKQILHAYPFAVAVIGEGEVTTAKLLEGDWSPSVFSTVPGVAYYEDGKVKVTGSPVPEHDLDRLPIVDHAQFFGPQRTTACMITSRGCPNRCSFCSLNANEHRGTRYRSVDNVMSEIEHLIATYPQMKNIWIHDDTLFLRNDRVIEMCKRIIALRSKVKFICSARLKPVSKEMVEMLDRANFSKVMFGLESGVNSILKAAHKGITKEDAIKVWKLFENTRIDVVAFLIVGLPGETSRTIGESIALIKRLQRIKYTRYYDIGSILTVYPGTEICELSYQAGILDEAFWLTDKPTPAFTAENNLEDLYRFKERVDRSLILDRIFTLPGFVAQLDMLPWIFGYLFRNKSLIVEKFPWLRPVFRRLRRAR